VVVGGLCALLGLALGPFLAGLTLRVPAGDPILGKRWWAGGEAGPRRTGIVTGLAALALGAVGAATGAHAELAAYLWLAAVGVTLAVIDLECLRLPDRLTLPSIPAGLVLLAIPGDWSALGRAGLAAVAAGGAALLLALVAPSGGLGLGDVKLLTVLGLFLGWLGWGVLVLGVAFGFALGALVAVGMLASRRAGLRDHLAFGPWLIAGALIAVVSGQNVVDAYLSVPPA
jgi:leader peptidase (prepilin peptidase) / N-methyltransferase